MSTRLKLAVTLCIGIVSIRGQAISTPPPSPELNLPAQKIGVDNLVSISIYDRPELTRTVRVPADGNIHLALLSSPIQAVGAMPADLEQVIAAKLVEEEILVRPVVSVAVVEYRSRPVSVVGAVRHPLTFQVSGQVRLLDALARAEGLAAEAGSEVLVANHPGTTGELVRRIPVKQLMNNANPEMNIQLVGGEEIRVPEAGKVYVVGNIKKPGVIMLHDGEDLTVLKVLALSEGLLPYATKDAFVYRVEAGATNKNEVRIPLEQIVQRKSPDFTLQQNDIFYIPDNKGRRLTLETLERIAGFTSAAGAAAIYGMSR